MRYINVCKCDMFSAVNVNLDHLNFCVGCIDGRRGICCGECYGVSNECDEPTSCLVQPIGAQCCEVMYFGCFGFRGELGFLNCDDICTYVVNNQFELLQFVLIPFILTCSKMRFLSLLLLGVCACSPSSVCEVVVVPYVVSAYVAVTVMHVCVLRE